MPNLTGLSDEEARRIQALSDKTKAEFAKAQSGEKARTPNATAGRPRQVDATLNHVLTPGGQTRMEKTPQGQQRENDANANADRIRQRTMEKAGIAQRRANARKAFTKARDRDISDGFNEQEL